MKTYYAIVIWAQLRIFILKAQKRFLAPIFLGPKLKKAATLGHPPWKYGHFKLFLADIGWKLKEELANYYYYYYYR